ncbi:MAG: hypothetical protein IJJ33_18840 [Victivallales bacterium]|nr:hypothetical protein [Victivallales bacterium]
MARTILLAVLAAALLPAAEIRFDSRNLFQGFTVERRLAHSIRDGYLHLEIQGRDSGIGNDTLRLQPAALDSLLVRYRASNLVGSSGGQLYFAAPDAPLGGHQVWNLPPMQGDGQWHTLQATPPACWRNIPVVGRLRLDLTDDGPGGSIDIEYILFRDNPRRETPAEWPAVKPELPERFAEQPRIPDDYWAAVMLSAPEDTPHAAPGDYFLRKSFTAPADVAKALVQLSVDDKYRLYFNGELVSDHTATNSWKTPEAVDVTARIRPGEENLIAIHYRNEGGPGGALFEATILRGDGGVEKHPGQAGCRSSASPAPGWERTGFDDSAWGSPILHGTPPAAPWTLVLPYCSLKGRLPLKHATVSVPGEAHAGENLPVTLECDAADGTFRATLVLESPNGRSISRRTEATECRGGRAVWQLPLPRFYATADMQVRIEPLDHEPLAPLLPARFRYLQRDLPGKAPNVAVRRDAHGRPCVEIDGKARYCVIANDLGNYIRPGGIHSALPADFRVCSVLQDRQDNEWQVAPGKYDFTPIDRVVDNLLESDGRALVLLAFGLEPPSWWAAANPAEITRYSDGTPVFQNVAAPSFASRVWRTHALASIRALAAHVQSAPYAPRLGGFLLTNGKSYEWQYWGGHEGARFSRPRMVDYSAPMQEEFRRRYQAAMPTTEERVVAANGLFYAPSSEAIKIAATRIQSDVLADFLVESFGALRGSLDSPKLVGAYYGYHFEYAGFLWTRQLSGHNSLARVLAEAHPDFLLSPPSYAVRQLGESGADMKPFRTIEEAGCLAIQDDDTRTHRTPWVGVDQAVTAQQTRDILRRNFGTALCRGECPMLVPMTGDEFGEPDTSRDLQVIRQAGQEALDAGLGRRAEIAVVVDERANAYLRPDTASYRHLQRRAYRADGTVSTHNAESLRLTGQLVSLNRARLGRLGAPVDYILASDVHRHIGQYRLWIFLDVFTADAFLRETAETLRAQGAALLWFYAPGIVDATNESFGAENIRRLTGFRVRPIPGGGTPEIRAADGTVSGYPEELPLLFEIDEPNCETIGTYLTNGRAAAARRGRDVLWCGNVMTDAQFREIARTAGCHIWSDSGDVLEAGFGCLVLHAAHAGRKRVLLPAPSTVSDLFTGEILAEGVEEFSFPARLHETRVFRVIPLRL